MTRRKGERPVLKRLNVLTPHSPVVRSIAKGQRWFDAWLGEECTPLVMLSRLTGIPRGRLDAIMRGDRVSRAEIDAFARGWCVSTPDLISTLSSPDLVVE